MFSSTILGARFVAAPGLSSELDTGADGGISKPGDADAGVARRGAREDPPGKFDGDCSKPRLEGLFTTLDGPEVPNRPLMPVSVGPEELRGV